MSRCALPVTGESKKPLWGDFHGLRNARCSVAITSVPTEQKQGVTFDSRPKVEAFKAAIRKRSESLK